MRDILFRGKAANREDYRVYRTTYKNGDWVYGLLTDKENYLGFAEMTNEGGVQCIEVDKDTVGQYIGVEDKNGKKVFEGDILRYTPRPKCTIYYKVIWNQEWSRFALVQWSTHKYHLYEWAQHGTIKYCCEVIGNIHDNPDLLESLESN